MVFRRLAAFQSEGVARTAKDDRSFLHALVGGRDGVVLTPQGTSQNPPAMLTPGTGLAVYVRDHHLFVNVPASRQADGGTFHVYNDAPVSVPLAAAPPAGQYRRDLIVCRVLDTELGDASNDVQVLAVTGANHTSSNPSPPSLDGLPGTNYAYGTVLVASGMTSIPAANISRYWYPAAAGAPTSWFGEDSRLQTPVAPGKTVTATHADTLRVAHACDVVGTVGMLLSYEPHYLSFSATFKLGSVAAVGRFGLVHPDIRVNNAALTGSEEYRRRHGVWHTIPVRFPLVPAGVHALTATMALSGGSWAGTTVQLQRWMLDLREVTSAETR